MAEKSERRLRAVLGHLKPGGGGSTNVSSSSAYRYTTSGNGLLSDEQRAAYERDGYLVVPGLVSRDDLQTYAERFKDICTGAVSVPRLTIMKDVSIAKTEFRKDQRAITKIQDFQVELTLCSVLQCDTCITV